MGAKTPEMKTESKPHVHANWHVAINIPLAAIWGIGIPVTFGIFAGWTSVTIAIVTVLWFILSMRFIDRGIPIITGPIVHFLFKHLGPRK